MAQFSQHERVARWLENMLFEGSTLIGVAWHVATAFIRVSTNPRIFDDPLSISFAKSRLDQLFSHPLVAVIVPTTRHWQIYAGMLTDLNLTGDIVMDAHIAAIAIEHNGSVASSDKDFRRFADYVKIIDPLANNK